MVIKKSYKDNKGNYTKYNKLGNPTIEKKGESIIKRKYDKNGRMISLQWGDMIQTWEYDDLGREIRSTLNGDETISEYIGDKLVHYKSDYFNGYEWKIELDVNGNEIHSINNGSNIEWWKEYDKNNNLIYYKTSKGYEKWYYYDENNNLIHSKDTNNCWDYWKYNKNNTIKYHKTLVGDTTAEWDYDKYGNELHFKDSEGFEYWNKYQYTEEENTYTKLDKESKYEMAWNRLSKEDKIKLQEYLEN